MKSNKSKNGRRDFLKGAAITAAAATVAATVSKTATAGETINTTGSGYQKTKHVKTYYETARF
jgi:nitrous oxide reductase